MTSHPLPQAARGDWLTLDGVWEVELPAGTTPRLIRVPGRLMIDASGWSQLEDTDLVDVHDHGAELTRHRGVRDDLPLWFGELGGLSMGSGEFAHRHVDDLAAGYRRIVEQVPMEAAGFVWTQLTDVAGEQNGLPTDDRRFKCDPAAIRAANEAFLGR